MAGRIGSPDSPHGTRRVALLTSTNVAAAGTAIVCRLPISLLVEPQVRRIPAFIALGSLAVLFVAT